LKPGRAAYEAFARAFGGFDARPGFKGGSA